MLKKLSALAIAYLAVFLPSQVLADDVNINVNPPANYGVAPGTPLGTIFSNIITIVFVLAAVVVLIMLIWGAFEWIFSAGDKEKIEKARGRIVNALIGLVLLALAFLIAKVVGQLTNIDILGKGLVIPRLGPALNDLPNCLPTGSPTIAGGCNPLTPTP